MKIKTTLITIFLVLSNFQFLAAAETWSIKNPDQEGWNELRKTRLYFHNSDLQRMWAEEGLALIDFKPSDRVLDFGSGDGKITASLSFRVQNVIGTDLSDHMLHFANTKYPQSDYKNLRYTKALSPDFSTQNFEYKFDKVVSFCVFHLVSSPVKVLQNIRKHMEKNGQLLLVYPSSSPVYEQAITNTLAKFALKAPNPVNKTELNMRKLEDAGKILADAGFATQVLEQKLSYYRYYDIEEYVQWGKGTMSANLGIPEGKEDDFFRAFVKEYATLDPNAISSTGTFSLLINHIIVKAINKN